MIQFPLTLLVRILIWSWLCIFPFPEPLNFLLAIHVIVITGGMCFSVNCVRFPLK